MTKSLPSTSQKDSLELRRDKGGEVGLAALWPLLVDNLDIGPQHFHILDIQCNRIPAICVISGNRGDTFDVPPLGRVQEYSAENIRFLPDGCLTPGALRGRRPTDAD